MTTAKRSVAKKNKKTLPIIVVIVAIVVVFGAVGIFALGGGVGGKLPEVNAAEQYVSPLTGQVSSEKLAARPLVVSIDNVGDAIPQSWLSKTDLVYEFPVEGKQTRLQAVYYGQFPEHFGPIRSTRPYFVDLTREYKAVFLAHGWSPQAREYLLSDVVPYINAMNSDCAFYRVDDKEAPHNSYIKWAEVKKKIDASGWWDEPQDIRPFKFLAGGQQNEGETAEEISFNYSAIDYKFKYDAETNKYTRTVFGEEYVDKETKKPITAYNVLVQKVTSSVLDAKGRLEIDMCSGGDAILFTNGKAVKGKWSRKDLDSRTVFVDTAGNEFRLTPGNTWVEVTDQNCELEYK